MAVECLKAFVAAGNIVKERFEYESFIFSLVIESISV